MIGTALVQARSNGSTPIRVLMADPDPSISMVYREPLLREGFELATAVSGLECVARLRECVPDVLVLEPQLLWGGGDGVLAMMCEIPQLVTVPVMVLTIVPRSSCLEPGGTFSDQRLSPQTARVRSVGGEAPQPAESSQTAFHFGRTSGLPGMFDRAANRWPRPRPACRDS